MTVGLLSTHGLAVLGQGVLPLDEPERALDIVSAVIEVTLLAWFFYALLRFLHGKAGLAVFKGVLITFASIFVTLALMVVFIGISFPRLEVAAYYMAPFMIVVLVVLFQPELRRGFRRVSEVGGQHGRGMPGQIGDLASAFRALSRRQTGALVVFERQTGIKGVQDTGVPLDAALSGAMLESIFYPRSPLHDGAVIVRSGRIVAACCMLPLTESTVLGHELGTRHRAAIGVTEDSDAVAVVVSEETGRITLAYHGKLHAVEDLDTLEETLTDFLEGEVPETVEVS